ncbi:MAG: Ig-like domain-containing protein [Spirochaetaceae bacterium]|nr:Ig-like domain-containing protein [Spirochaetaceae bacterium]
MIKIAFVLTFFMFVSCAFVNLEPIWVEIAADGPGGTLVSAYSPVNIRFDCEMEKAEVESVVSVKSIQGNTDVDRRWEAAALVLTPVEGWSPGVVYTVSLAGTIRAVDGREERVAEHAFFHYGQVADIPFVVSFYPPDGAKTGVNEKSGAFVTLYFSQPMDTYSVEDAFTINGFSDKEYNWNEEKTTVTVTNKKNIAPLEKYVWTLDTAARSAAGFSLAKKVSAQWTSDAQTLKPVVSGVYPVAKRESAYGFEWIETGSPIEAGFGYGEAVKVTFSKRMDSASLKNIIRFEPSLSGRTETLSPWNIVFIPERDPVIGAYYTMTISGEAKDEDGLTMGEDYIARFKPDILYLDPVITVLGEPVSNGGTVDLSFGGAEAEAGISIIFGQPFLTENQIDCINQIKLSKVFPVCAPVPVLTSADWTGGKILYQVWSKFSDSNVHNHPHYYKYVIPGGQNGVTNGKGAYLQKDVVFYIKVTLE